MRNILFYKYVPIENLEQFRDEHWDFCRSLNLLGKILIADEGINGCLTGTVENTQAYMDAMGKDPRFADMAFKMGNTNQHNFKKMIVRIRKEIVTSHLDVTPDQAAPYIEPEQLKKELDEGKELILIDARNLYEANIGKFKGAITPDVDVFSQWPEAVEKLKNLKDKPIVTYCTGGIRCEKASAHMIKQGFTNVRQLHGGIIRYGELCSNEHWEGKCFVFDTRGAVEIDPKKQTEPITQCTLCNLPNDTYHNCAFVDCDKRFISCEKCHAVLEGCCTKNCKNHMQKGHEKSTNKGETNAMRSSKEGMCSL